MRVTKKNVEKTWPLKYIEKIETKMREKKGGDMVRTSQVSPIFEDFLWVCSALCGNVFAGQTMTLTIHIIRR